MSEKIKVGFAVCGSFCTFEKAFETAENLVAKGYDLTPIMSFNARNISTRFGNCEENALKLEKICGKKVLSTIEEVEPIGPKKSFDILVVAPCTSNTLSKLAVGITDTPVTMAVKSHVRNSRPVLIALATNDALAASGKNIGTLMNYRNYYFVPYSQDDYMQKPYSMIARFETLEKSLELALLNKQIQPLIF